MKVSAILAVCALLASSVHGKYVEGHLKTLDDWAFVARFCFISGRGRYEYQIEFERKYGEPSLLLYYDEKTQWPAVYKTDKTCEQKLAVLSAADNQIVSLSAKTPYNYLSGCTLRSSLEAEEEMKPPVRPQVPDETIKPDDLEPGYFDQFLKTSTTEESSSTYSTFTFTDVSLDNASTTVMTYLGDISLGNSLENGTAYQVDVEQLFEGVTQSSAPQEDRLRRSLPFSLFKKDTRGRIIVSCRNAGGFTSVRERWWYIAISNCGSSKGLDIKYKFRMTNGPPGDFWHEHFSADEMYIPPILLTECLAYTFLLLGMFLCAIELKSRHLFHCTYRLFTFSATVQWVGTLVQGVAWARYAVSGLGPNTAFGGMLMGASEVSFLALMLLMAKGYTITRARLSTATTVKLTVFINIYIVAYISLYILQAETFDPGEVLNIYESPAGFGLIGLRCGAWGAFLMGVAATLRKYPEKSAFYYPFGLLGSVWILAGPALTLVGIGVLDAWVRESVMCAISGTVAFGGHAAFLWLTWPSRANRSFPYHVRTNHVGVANTDDGTDYPRHPYEPSGLQHEQNIIIPLSRRTEELINGVYSQYIIERELYGSNSNPISHISFPQTASAPALPDPNMPLTSPNPAQRRLASFRRRDTPKTDSGEQDAQVDSGHPSLENTSSPNTTGPSSGHDTPVRAKNNPFLVNGQQRQPNKVILEPIEQPLRGYLQDTYQATTVNASFVPRHLFAAKSTTNE
ncbi:transmembrane protein 145-like [Phlebotomus argentipes]|uniref:transmembrane protein 145-like n=1 Tax=Phlebotomus argentipes TaxID=94469 RepID=UPI00289303F9|nr:transmembrane protein 145-like [Phlebotomus argentipes]